MDKRNMLKLSLGCVAMPAVTSLLAGCIESKPSFTSIDVTGVDYAKDFSLTDQNGKIQTLKNFAGKVVVVFFGYTQCPDVCPTSMAELSEVRKALGKDGDRLQVIFITVDPERDTSTVLKAYMSNFDPTFLALRPESDAQLAALAKDFKVYYKRVEGQTATSYTMDHSAGSYVFDTKGRLRLFTRYGSGAAALTNDIRQLLK